MDAVYILWEILRILFWYLISLRVRLQIFKIVAPCQLCHSVTALSLSQVAPSVAGFEAVTLNAFLTFSHSRQVSSKMQ